MNFLEFCRQQFHSMHSTPGAGISEMTAAAGCSHYVNRMHPLVLAYVGDAIFELFIRLFVLQHETKVRNLHSMATGLVKASTQAGMLRNIETALTEEEQRVARRGRNAKTGHTPKNAVVIDYRLATGFEALLGYLFFMGQDERLLEILSNAVNEGQKLIKS